MGSPRVWDCQCCFGNLFGLNTASLVAQLVKNLPEMQEIWA